MSLELTQEQLELGKRLVGLQDWLIQVTYSHEDPSSDCYGKCYCEPDWKRAHIIIYTGALQSSSNIHGDTVWGIYLHELGEAVASDCVIHLNEDLMESAEFTRVRDRIAEYVRQIIPRVAGITYEELTNEEDFSSLPDSEYVEWMREY